MGRRAWFILIGILSTCIVTFYVNSMDHSPCLERITYENIDKLEGIDLDSLFKPADSIELEQVYLEWQKFDKSSDQISRVTSLSYVNGREAHIWEHFAQGRKHYGVVIPPTDYSDTKDWPVLIWAHGLNQKDPNINLRASHFFKLLLDAFPDHLVLIPSYRGQSLEIGGVTYCSDGFFGDAYDGATDDALRFLELSKNRYKVDNDNISTYGISRGGTVALLTGIRDTSIRTVVSQSGPSIFHQRRSYNMYGFQFKYQFLMKDKPMSELRKKLLKCSPLYFIDRYPKNVLLIHGENDPIVPVDNSSRIIDRIPEQIRAIITKDGHNIFKMEEVKSWVDKPFIELSDT